MSRYSRVTGEDRLRLKAYLDSGISQSMIADKLGFDRSTIWRELKRNSGGRGYRTKQAARKSSERQIYRHKPRKMVPENLSQPPLGFDPGSACFYADFFATAS